MAILSADGRVHGGASPFIRKLEQGIFDKEVFAALSAEGESIIPKAYKDYKIMRQMRWSFDQLMNTPADVVADVWRYMNTEATHANLKAKQRK